MRIGIEEDGRIQEITIKEEFAFEMTILHNDSQYRSYLSVWSEESLSAPATELFPMLDLSGAWSEWAICGTRVEMHRMNERSGGKGHFPAKVSEAPPSKMDR